MVKDGRPLTVAEAAMVSTATAYRYFPSPQSLEETGDGLAARMDAVIRYLAGLQFGDEPSRRGLVCATSTAGSPRAAARRSHRCAGRRVSG
jgi:hypothetical protein